MARDFRNIVDNISQFVPDLSVILIKQRVNRRYQQILKLRDWEYLNDNTTTGTSWSISTGTSCKISYGSTSLISRDQSGCSFYSHHAGWWIRFGSEPQPYEVSSVSGTSRLTLLTPYTGTSVGLSGSSFTLFKATYRTGVSCSEIKGITYKSRLKEKSQTELARLDPEYTDTGEPIYYAITEQSRHQGRVKFRLYPITDSTSYVLKIYYKKLLSDLSSDTDIPVCSPELLESWALYDCYKMAAIKNPVYMQLMREQKEELRAILHEEIENDLGTTSLPSKIRDATSAGYINDDYHLDHDTEPW